MDIQRADYDIFLHLLSPFARLAWLDPYKKATADNGRVLEKTNARGNQYPSINSELVVLLLLLLAYIILCHTHNKEQHTTAADET